jgi:mannose-6-phosphate isomerase-like protein (cupin superfamily)
MELTTKTNIGDAVQRMKAEMLTMPQMELETYHFWADGMYARMLPRPRGATIVGRVHKKEHFYIVMSGAVRITNGEDEAVDVVAPAVLVSRPGTQRAVVALEDSVCMTVHRTEAKTVEDAEADLVEEDPLSLYGPGNTLRRLT